MKKLKIDIKQYWNQGSISSLSQRKDASAGNILVPACYVLNLGFLGYG